MPELPDALLVQLLELIDRLRGDSEGFLGQPDQQVWYNRGYANGMVLALQGLVAAARLGGRSPDAPDRLADHRVTPWGRAYRHGEEVGSREIHEITGVPPQ